MVPALNFSSVTWQKQLRKTEKTLQRKKGKKEKRRGEFKRCQVAPTRCQNLSISTINRLY
jgi:hypothetical protein